MPDARNALIRACVVIERDELMRVARYRGEGVDDASARHIRARLEKAGIPVKPAFGGLKITVTTGVLIQKRDSKTDAITFTWRAD